MEKLLWEFQLQQDASPWRQQIQERRAAEERRREFVRKANRVAQMWKKVMDAYAREGILNVKDAHALSKAFHDMEAAGWRK